MGPSTREETFRSPMSGTAKRRSEDEGVMGTASLEVVCAAAGAPGPTQYECVYTRGGWIWRTSHRYSEWLSLKERLRADFGARNLPTDKMFPQKENVGAIVTKLLTSCQGCREGGARPVGILEDRRRGLQAYFSLVLEEQRELWDASADIKAFFFPGPPTSYSAALSRRRSEQLKEEKLKAKEASSATSIMASSLKSTLGSLFESSSTAAAPPASTAAAATATPSRQQSLSATSSVRSTSGSFALLSPVRGGDAPATAAAAAGGAGAMGAPSPSMLGRFSAMKSQMPSLRDLLFDDAQGPSGSASGSRASSRHGGGGGGGSRHSKLPSSSNRPPSESGVTDPDGGMSETGSSDNSAVIRE